MKLLTHFLVVHLTLFTFPANAGRNLIPFLSSSIAPPDDKISTTYVKDNEDYDSVQKLPASPVGALNSSSVGGTELQSNFFTNFSKFLSTASHVQKQYLHIYQPSYYYDVHSKCLFLNLHNCQSDNKYFVESHFTFLSLRFKTIVCNNFFVDDDILNVLNNLIRNSLLLPQLVFQNCGFPKCTASVKKIISVKLISYKLSVPLLNGLESIFVGLKSLSIDSCLLSLIDSFSHFHFKNLEKFELVSCDLDERSLEFFFKSCKSTLLTLTFDNCLFPKTFRIAPEIFPDKLKTTRIISCKINEDVIPKVLLYFKDSLECWTMHDIYLFSSIEFPIGLKLKNLCTLRIIRSAMNTQILCNIFSILPTTLNALELSFIFLSYPDREFIVYSSYLKLDFSQLEIARRFPHLQNLIIMKNSSKKLNLNDFQTLTEIGTCRKLHKSDILHNLAALSNLKKISCLHPVEDVEIINKCAKRNVIIDCAAPFNVGKCHLMNLPNVISTFTNISFPLGQFADNEFNELIQVSTQNTQQIRKIHIRHVRNMEDLFKINRILHSLPRIYSIAISFELTLPNECIIIEIFNKMKIYENIKKFTMVLYSSKSHPSEWELVFQFIKKFPNLQSFILKAKYLQDEGIVEKLNNEKLLFPYLQQIEVIFINSSGINHLLWFLDNTNIKKLSIKSNDFLKYNDGMLNEFSNTSLEELLIWIHSQKERHLFKSLVKKLPKLKTLILYYSGISFDDVFEENQSVQKIYLLRSYIDYSPVFKAIKRYKNLNEIHIYYLSDYLCRNAMQAFNKHFQGTTVKLLFSKKFAFE